VDLKEEKAIHRKGKIMTTINTDNIV
jgi:hypothetical protein